MAPVIAPLSQADCEKSKCDSSELGPAKIVLRPYNCEEDDMSNAICIDCSDQRNDLSIAFTRSFISIPTQCSSRTRKREGSKEIMLNISLGAAAGNADILAAIFDTTVATDPANPDCKIVSIIDEPGKCPKHWEVAVLPLDGGKVDESMAFVLYYAIAHSESFNFTFSPSTPREVTLSLYAEPHPVNNKLADFLFNCGDVIKSLDCEGNSSSNANNLLAAAA